MARIPEGASLVDNPVSAAPGFRIENVFVFAGVPAIMQGMFDAIAPSLVAGPPIEQRTVTCHIPESMFAEPLAAIQARHEEVEIGSYPFFRQGGFGVNLVVRGTDPGALDRVASEIVQMIRDLGGEPVESE
jgi:molybdopterin-biosynthesis enzyme MoeA-like protein